MALINTLGSDNATKRPFFPSCPAITTASPSAVGEDHVQARAYLRTPSVWLVPARVTPGQGWSGAAGVAIGSFGLFRAARRRDADRAQDAQRASASVGGRNRRR
jgi:hypothetical protein